MSATVAAWAGSTPATRLATAELLLRTLRSKIRTALTIGDARRRSAELTKVANSLRDITGPLAEDALRLARQVEDCAAYGGVAALAREVR